MSKHELLERVETFLSLSRSKFYKKPRDEWEESEQLLQEMLDFCKNQQEGEAND